MLIPSVPMAEDDLVIGIALFVSTGLIDGVPLIGNRCNCR